MAPDDGLQPCYCIPGLQGRKRAEELILPFKESPQKADQPLQMGPECSPRDSGPTYYTGGWGSEVFISQQGTRSRFLLQGRRDVF